MTPLAWQVDGLAWHAGTAHMVKVPRLECSESLTTLQKQDAPLPDLDL